MNVISIFSLKILRKIYTQIYKQNKFHIPREEDPNKASKVIYNLLQSEKPCMIARFGSTELSALINYIGVNSSVHSIVKYIQGKQLEWWWNRNIMEQMQQWSGFYPPTPENMQKFGELMINETKEVDILGSWIINENYIFNYIKKAQIIHLRLLEPFWSNTPWTIALKDKKVLVIHPFAQLIYKQYTEKRTLLFKNPNILPPFKLEVIQAVQSLGGNNNDFKDWFEALQWMKDEIDKKDYDICLIGCGAYGFPLAAHVKKQGKKAVHLGGALQLLFGIKGKRWENPNYGVKEWGIPYGSYSSLINEYWVRPGDLGRPQNAEQVEGACYW
ncbi:hypothetical protein [Phocaeicola plebeius]|uniref:hypothetical protein n=1 Tax=Phocaeicola plebeius TaxID=310297 RepID=UPI0026F27AA4|nr:hypothetical protein [Phocaeicola plebeius]